MFENELAAGTLAVIPTPGLKLRSGFGFIHLRNRSLSPAALAFMQAFRDEDNAYRERERGFERLHVSARNRLS
jgi:DNA-binding transcriptional LysR family regulator